MLFVSYIYRINLKAAGTEGDGIARKNYDNGVKVPLQQGERQVLSR
jgi:hypothetical protein